MAEQHVPSVPETRGNDCSGLLQELNSSATARIAEGTKSHAGPLEHNLKFSRLTFSTAVSRQTIMCQLTLHFYQH
ncbi:hypothetical protein EXN66_Car022267 [Channa argus]|uniref:Uncharacterized protein n=1 Tax=Channa argus TaxID=215402 RepID=A0A6G1QVL9_CHAAH|nr:hypothetical protein EXN66_Car022267 [Channa argus]